MTRILDATVAIRKASALRALCLRLPHVPTPVEMRRLRRFEALAAGWRRWWYQGESERLSAMAARLPPGFVDGDRRLAQYDCAAAFGVRR